MMMIKIRDDYEYSSWYVPYIYADICVSPEPKG